MVMVTWRKTIGRFNLKRLVDGYLAELCPFTHLFENPVLLGHWIAMRHFHRYLPSPTPYYGLGRSRRIRMGDFTRASISGNHACLRSCIRATCVIIPSS
jgi:hypothetical protein